MTQAHATTDHQRIKQWIEQRGGHPATVAATGEQGILRVDFDPPDDALEAVDWDTFFDTFERRELAFLYQDKTNNGQLSRFNKFIDRRSVEANDLEQAPDEENAASRASTSRSKSRSGRSRRGAGAKTAAGGSTQRASTSEAQQGQRRSAKSGDAEQINVNDPNEVEEEIEDQLDPDEKE